MSENKTSTPVVDDKWAAIAKDYQSVSKGPKAWPTEALLARANELRPFSTATSILDNGCGPGPITIALLEGYEIPDSATIRAADFSSGMLSMLQQHRAKKVAEDNKLWGRLQCDRTLDAHDLEGIEQSSLSHVLAGLLYMLLPDPRKGLTATYQALAEDGIVALSCWHGSQWIDAMKVLYVLRPNLKPFLPVEWTSVEGVKGELEATGFRDVGAQYVQATMALEAYESTADFFMTKLPNVIEVLQDFSKEEKVQVREMMIAKLKEVCPEVPGMMTGTAIVGWGRK